MICKAEEFWYKIRYTPTSQIDWHDVRQSNFVATSDFIPLQDFLDIEAKPEDKLKPQFTEFIPKDRKNQEKRAEILEWAREYEAKGFTVTGKMIRKAFRVGAEMAADVMEQLRTDGRTDGVEVFPKNSNNMGNTDPKADELFSSVLPSGPN